MNEFGGADMEAGREKGWKKLSVLKTFIVLITKMIMKCSPRSIRMLNNMCGTYSMGIIGIRMYQWILLA